MDLNGFRIFLFYLLIVVGVLFVFLLGSIIYNGAYLIPIASENANEECKKLGFDQVKDFKRVGFFSITPVAIRCEYAERFTDLGVRTN